MCGRGRFRIPDACCVGPQGEPQTNAIGTEKEEGRNMAEWTDGISVELVCKTRCLREDAPLAVCSDIRGQPCDGILLMTCSALQFILLGLANEDLTIQENLQFHISGRTGSAQRLQSRQTTAWWK